MVLAPVRAIAIAGELIRAALPKRSLTEEPSVPAAAVERKLSKRRRGGDPRATKRERRDEALRELRKLTGPGKSHAHGRRKRLSGSRGFGRCPKRPALSVN